MPTVTVEPFARPEEVMDYWIDRLEAYKETLGLNYVAGYDQKLIPANSYPVVAVNPGQTTKEIHGVRTWLYTWKLQFFIMHARAAADHLLRSREEAQLVTNLVTFLEQDKELGGRTIFSYVTDEAPGILRPFSDKSELVLSTRLDWFATSEGRF